MKIVIPNVAVSQNSHSFDKINGCYITRKKEYRHNITKGFHFIRLKSGYYEKKNKRGNDDNNVWTSR